MSEKSVNCCYSTMYKSNILDKCHRHLQAEWVIEDKKPEKNWPQKGCVEFKDYGVRYREGLDLVLKGITCSIKPCEKVFIFYFAN